MDKKKGTSKIYTGFLCFLLILKDGWRRKEKVQAYLCHEFRTMQLIAQGVASMSTRFLQKKHILGLLRDCC